MSAKKAYSFRVLLQSHWILCTFARTRWLKVSMVLKSAISRQAKASKLSLVLWLNEIVNLLPHASVSLNWKHNFLLL